MVLALIILFGSFAATYFVAVPCAARSRVLTSAGLFAPHKDKAMSLKVFMLMPFVLVALILVSHHDPEALQVIFQVALTVVAICGIYVVTGSPLWAVFYGAALFLLVSQGIGGVPLLDFSNIFVALGALFVICHTYSLSGAKALILILTAGDILLISMGVTTHIFPLAFELAPGHFLGFFYLPAHLKIGCGDLLGLSLLAAITLREASNRALVFIIYSLAFAVCAAVTISGMVVAFPATVPLLPALLCHELTRRKSVVTSITTPSKILEPAVV